jgi:hypothetical protein
VRYTPFVFSCFVLIDLMTFFFSFAKQHSSETRYLIAVVFDLQQRSQVWVREEQKLKEIIARQFVHLLCQSISHDSCVIQKTTRLLLDYLRIARVFLTKSANPLTLHYQDKHTLMIYLWRKVVCLSWVQIFQTVQCLLLLLRFRWWWYH